jgi:hypothetical protein
VPIKLCPAAEYSEADRNRIEAFLMVMSQTIGFDVYGTLVDPADMGLHLEKLPGDKTRAFGERYVFYSRIIVE